MKIIDLTLELYNGLRSFESHPPVKIEEQSTFATSKHRYEPPCNGFESRLITFSDHSGTHIDAPLHFIEGGQAANEMSLENTCGEAVLLDVSDLKSNDEPVTGDMLEKAEKTQNITVEENDIVLVKTHKLTWGKEGFHDIKTFHISAGEWLNLKKIKLVGIDLPNIDINENMKREVHLKLLGNNIYIVENLVNMDQLPKNKRFYFQALPLKLKNATASPVRAVAFIE